MFDHLIAALVHGGYERIATTGCSTPLPATTAGVDFPVHVLVINAMGVHLLDYLQFEELGTPCHEGRPTRSATCSI